MVLCGSAPASKSFPMELRCSAQASQSSAAAPRPAKGAGGGWQMMLLVVRGAVPANHRAHFKIVSYL